MSYKFLLTIIIIFFALSLSILVLLSNVKDKRNQTLSVVILLSALWIISGLLADRTISYDTAFFWTRFAIIPPALVLPTFLYFSFIFPRPIRQVLWKQVGLIFIPSLFFILLSTTTLNIKSIVIHEWGTEYYPGILYIIFIPYFLLYFSLSIHKLFTSYKGGDLISKAQIKYVLIGLFSAFAIGIITNVIFPLFGNGRFAVLGPSFSILFLSFFTTYAILKHHLFNIKVLATEVLVFIIWTFLLMQFILSTTLQLRIVNGGLLLFIIFFGILLIKSVIKEVHIREKLQLLTTELEKTNNKLVAADQQKTQFLGFASHQVRSPLTAIKGAVSMLIDGSYGPIENESQRNQLDHIYQSSSNLIHVIEDLLNVSKIEQGGMKYEMEPVDLKKLIQEIINDLSSNAQLKGLQLTIEENKIDKAIVLADAIKIRQVVMNLIDNAIKYSNTGVIRVILSHLNNKRIKLEIIDTGIGIASSNISQLFKKFSRGDESMMNVGGSGLGLFLAKEIITAHHGTIGAKSLGKNKGSTFYIVLDEIVDK